MRSTGQFFILLLFFPALSLFGAGVELDLATTDTPAEAEFPVAEDAEDQGLRTLITFSEESLANAKELLRLVEEYKQIREKFLVASDPSKHTREMVMSGYQVLAKIQSDHFDPYFQSDFMDELARLAQVAMKNGWVPS